MMPYTVLGVSFFILWKFQVQLIILIIIISFDFFFAIASLHLI